jgi:hypothetical protein
MDMRVKFILAGIVFITITCDTKEKSSIVGTWKVDSIYTNYNGFTFTRKDIADEPLLEYQSDGRLKMTKGTESRFFLFDAIQDTLFHRNLDHAMLEKFLIQKLNGNQLALRKEMSPVFTTGKNQKRYEIRYLSKNK